MQLLRTLFVLASSASIAFASPLATTDIAGFDMSHSKPAAFWPCMVKKGFQKVAIRAYSQACGSGGKVDSNFAPSYKAAMAAGITNIDAYLFPCTGNQTTGPGCKSPSQQIAEFESAISSANAQVTTRWLDIEPGTRPPCKAWNGGSAANLALAQQWVQAIKASGNKWGIYGNGNEWTRMFASRKTDIGADDLPLWAVQTDGKPGVATVKTFMAGWTSAAAKQYKENLVETECSKGEVDLTSFAI